MQNLRQHRRRVAKIINQATAEDIHSQSGKRGMNFESLINASNALYRQKGWAVVDKVATPFRQVGIHKGGVFLAVRDQASTVDYYGCFQGRALVFEAKSTRETTRLPHDNFLPHQIEYLRDALQQGAIAFSLIEFAKLDEIYLLPAQYLVDSWEKGLAGGRKSIPIEHLRLFGTEVHPGRGIPLDYLSVVQQLWKRVDATKEKNNEFHA
ncbi:MAG: Holliday junction resolvase RecU [Firmicutes bacterium]|nr:Holliday junction resolvase RecU [Bacillota bacterium]